MPGAFTGTASSTTSQMEKMLRVFSPLYELSIFRLVAISNFVDCWSGPFRFGRTFACGGRRPGIDVAPGSEFGHQPVTFSCSPDAFRTPARGSRTGGSKHGISQNA